MPVFNWRGLFNPIDHTAHFLVNQWGSQFRCAWQFSMLSNYLRVIIFTCNFWICTISHKSVSNVVNLVSLEENEISKCRWENSTNVCVNYVTVQWSDLKLGPLIQVRTFLFWGVYKHHRTFTISIHINYLPKYLPCPSADTDVKRILHFGTFIAYTVNFVIFLTNNIIEYFLLQRRRSWKCISTVFLCGQQWEHCL